MTPAEFQDVAGQVWKSLTATSLKEEYLEDTPSERVLAQRVRNRIMDAIEILADGNEGVVNFGFGYFEFFYDWIPHRDDGDFRPNSAISAEEQEKLREVSIILDDASDTTHHDITVDEFIETGWPSRIAPVAQRALEMMLKRGKLSEEFEER